MTEEKKTEEKTKSSSKVNSPAQDAPAKPRGAADAAAAADHAPSKKSSSPAAAKAAAPKQKSSGTLRIRQIKSGICAPVDQKQTLFGLGLRRIRQEVVRPDTPAVRGQIHKIRHLVEIVEGA
jgi:large subunit ribosomal protein L30